MARPTEHRGPLVVAFDLDGTLVGPRTLLSFIAELGGPPALACAALGGLRGAGLPPARARFKEAAVGTILRGRRIEDVRRAGERLAGAITRDRLDQGMVARVELHRQRGARLVLITGALDVYAEPIAEHLAFDHVIATEVAVDGNGRCTGRLRHADLNGERKIALLRAWLGPDADRAKVVAYGNSRDDDALLAFARRTQASPSQPKL